MPIRFKVNHIMKKAAPGPDLSKGGNVFFYQGAETGLMFKPYGHDPVPIHNVVSYGVKTPTIEAVFYKGKK